MTDDEQGLLADYKRLHDGLSDMIESGRLVEAMIPDDYRWLVESLANLAVLDQKVRDFDESES